MNFKQQTSEIKKEQILTMIFQKEEHDTMWKSIKGQQSHENNI